MARKEITSGLLLVLTALIWGTAFVSQSLGMESMGPCTFNGVRSLLACGALLPVLAWVRRSPSAAASVPGGGAGLLRSGLVCGTVLALASGVQQVAILHSSVGKAGFLTSLYIIIVPVLGTFCGRRAPARTWFCAALALAGAYLLCVKGEFVLQPSDILLVAGAFLFALHIIVVDRYAPGCEVIALSCVQLFTCGALNVGAALVFERITLRGLGGGIFCLMYAAFLSSALAYTLQIVGQRHVHPVVASLIMSLESVFAALSGWLFLHQALTAREAAGCAVIFAAVALSQLRRIRPPAAP